MDVNGQGICVNWHHYLELYCTFEAGQVEKSNLIKFWQRFFDEHLTGFCVETDYLKLLEQIIRGVTLSKPSKTTKLFALMYQSQLKEAGCLNDQKELIMDKYREALERGAIDLQLLCSALGT